MNHPKKANLFFQNGSQQDNDFSEFVLKENNIVLQEVKVAVKKASEPKFGTITNITNPQINALPSISRNLQDYVRLVPQAKVNGDGGISLAGQNNKFNAFFIDGANNNDMLGLAPSGINGGQTASPPVSIEAIEEITVLLSPFDVQYSNFTGGSINAITKSGSNSFKSSAWYYFRNEQMAGRSSQPLEVSGSPGIYEQQRLSSFFNQTSGVWASGPVIKKQTVLFFTRRKTNGAATTAIQFY
jgi:outer membrane receptor for ferrienterochelin and colicin